MTRKASLLVPPDGLFKAIEISFLTESSTGSVQERNKSHTQRLTVTESYGAVPYHYYPHPLSDFKEKTDMWFSTLPSTILYSIYKQYSVLLNPLDE